MFHWRLSRELIKVNFYRDHKLGQLQPVHLSSSHPASDKRNITHVHTIRLHKHIHTEPHTKRKRETHTKRTWMYNVISFDNPPSQPRRFLPFNENRPRERRPSHRWRRNRRRRIPAPGTTVISQLLRKIVTCNYDNTATVVGCLLQPSHLCFLLSRSIGFRGGSVLASPACLSSPNPVTFSIKSGTDRGGGVYRRGTQC